jgi:hypothetical protein
MAAAVRSMWGAVAPGGALAITTWGPRFFEPVNTVFWDAVRDLRPDLHKGFHPWDRIVEPPALRSLLREGGVENAEVVAEAGTHPIATPDAFWSAALGSGLRGTLDQLDDDGRERVRAATTEFIVRQRVREIEANVVYAIARKV